MEPNQDATTVDLRAQLERFRDTHPYQHLIHKGTHWEYIASGRGERALLLLGGGLSTGETSFQTILRLESRFRVISPSYPPAGRMAPITDGLTAILTNEGFRKAHVFGHSLGAGIAHVYTRLHAERVDRLILDGFGLYTKAHTRVARLFLKLPYPILRGYYRLSLRRRMAGAPESQRKFFQGYVDELFDRLHTRETFLGQMRLLTDIFDHRDQYCLFQPVERPGRILLILAEDDQGFSPGERAALIEAYPGANVHAFKQGGHLSGFTHPQEFNAVVDAFLLG